MEPCTPPSICGATRGVHHSPSSALAIQAHWECGGILTPAFALSCHDLLCGALAGGPGEERPSPVAYQVGL